MTESIGQQQKIPNFAKSETERACPGRVGDEVSEGTRGGLKAIECSQGNESLVEEKLLEAILSRENLMKALKRVETNKGASGIDGQEYHELRGYLKEHWIGIKQQIQEGIYRPAPVKAVKIAKPGGGERRLGIPTCLDRFLQQAIYQVIGPIFDKEFSDSSYGFREGRSQHQAIAKARGYREEGYRYVVDIDLEKMFDGVNHDILMVQVVKKIRDKRVLKLIRRYLQAGMIEGGLFAQTREGVPQGGPLSPLLSNVMLDVMDKELEKRSHRFCRWADDCNIYVRTQRAGERVMESISRFIEKKLRLKVNMEKSAVGSMSKRQFLGYSFWGKNGLRIAAKSYKRLKEKLRDETRSSKSMKLEKRIYLINQLAKGWIQYFRFADAKKGLEEIDHWLRRRLRAVLWKQWKSCRGRIRALRRLGARADQAYMMGCAGAGRWHMAKVLNSVVKDEYFRQMGLRSLMGEYLKLKQHFESPYARSACTVV